MKTKFGFTKFSIIIILTLILCGVYPGGVPRAIAQDGPMPFISVNPVSHWVYAYDWPDNETLTLTTGTYTTTANMAPIPWYPGNYYPFTLPDSVNLNPGVIITVTDGPTTKSLAVMNFAVTSLDKTTNTISGTASPNGTITVCSDNTPGDCRHTTVGESDYVWTTPYETGSFTLKPGSYGWASEAESDRDETYFYWTVPNPRFEVRANIDQVRGWDWTKGETLNLQIDDLITPVNPDYATAQTVGVAPWDSNQSYIEFNLSGIYDIKPGDVVSLTNGSITKSTMVTNLEITGINVGNDTVSGKAAAGTNVDLWACDPNNCSNTYRHVTADGDGTWIADFSTFSDEPDEQNTFNIVPGTWVDSQQVDGDSDSTMYGMNVPNPAIIANPGAHWVYGEFWPLGVELTLTIGNYTGTSTTIIAPWDPNKIEAWFDLTGKVDLIPGNVVSVTDGLTTRSLTIANLSVTAIDVANNTISGTSSSNASLYVCANSDPEGCHSTSAGNDGLWSYTFDSLVFVLQPGMSGWASEVDPVGNQTGTDWYVSNPRINVHLNESYIEAYEWPLNSTLHLKIKDNGKTYNAKQVTTPAPWDSTIGYVKFELGSDFTLEPGQVVTISDGSVSKTLTVMDLYSTSFNHSTRTVYGHADPGAQVQVEIWSATGETLTVLANGEGYWEAHSDLSDDPFHFWDGGMARSADADGDITAYNLKSGDIAASPEDDTIGLMGCLDYQTYVLTIDDPSNGPSIDYTRTFSSNPNDPTICADTPPKLGGFDLDVGDKITVTSRNNVKTLEVRPLNEIYYNIISDTIHGTGRLGDWAFLWIYPGFYRDALVDPNGNWITDFSSAVGPDWDQAAFDILPGQGWGPCQVDEDGDFSCYYSVIPFPNHGNTQGNGWFTSPAGAYPAKPAFSGKATFALSVKYEKTTPVPLGSVRFSFKDFAFQSSSFNWMVIEGERMQLTGSGMVNSKGGYGFMIDAAKNPPGADGKDTFRIRIWDLSSGQVVYDNLQGAADYVIPVTPVQGGTIKLTP